MATIPDLRAEMKYYLNNSPEQYIPISRYVLARWERELYRRKPVRPPRPRRRVTPPKEKIIKVATENPAWDLEQIAQSLGTNIARVSEAISGFRR